MPTALLCPPPKFNAFTNASVLGAGFKLYTYAANTETPQATYSDRSGSIPNSNPIILDARGEAIVYLTPGIVYDFVLRDDQDQLVWTREDVIADAGDANAVSFVQSGSGAIQRAVQDELRDRISIRQFGAVADGVTDCSEAIQSATAEALARGYGRVHLPAGTYYFTNPVTFSMTGQSGVILCGDGPELTQLVFDTTSGNGLEFSSPSGNWWLNVAPHNAIGVEDLTVVTAKDNLGVGIKFNMGSLEGRPCPSVVVNNVIVRGKDDFANCFATGVEFLDTAEVHSMGLRVIQGGPGNFNGTGILIHASDAATDPTSYKLFGTQVIFGNIGIDVDDHVEGIYLTQPELIGMNRGYRQNVAAESGLHVVGGHSSCVERCFDLGGVYDFSITGHLAYKIGSSATFRHFVIDNCGSYSITGNQLRGSLTVGEVGILVSNAPADTTHGGMISGNQLANLDLPIQLASTSARVAVGDNNFTNCNNRVIDNATGDNKNFVRRREYSISTVFSLVGGAALEVLNVPIPAGTFIAKPSVVFMNSGQSDVIGVYDWAHASSTATNAVMRLHKLGGGTIGAGNTRFSVLMKE